MIKKNNPIILNYSNYPTTITTATLHMKKNVRHLEVAVVRNENA